MGTKMLTRSLLLACACLFASPCPADLISASTAYAKGDYTKAFTEFRELAEIGQPTAQFNVAVMYAKGQGVRQSYIYAYAWASLAATNGLDKAKTLADALRPNLAPGSESVAADIAAHYSNAVLDAQLNPLIVDTGQDKHPCHLVHAYIPEYPMRPSIVGWKEWSTRNLRCCRMGARAIRASSTHCRRDSSSAPCARRSSAASSWVQLPASRPRVAR